MAGFLATMSLVLWFVLMIWLYFNLPAWLFVPLFVFATFGYLRLLEVRSS